jgi:transcriptional regulator with XRE-family HTH domain
MTHAPGLSEIAAANVKRLRQDVRLSQAEFAERVAALGVDMNRSIVANIEGGRRESLTLEEVAAFAVVLNVSPTNLMLPTDDTAPVAVTPEITDTAHFVRSWIYGRSRLPSVGHDVGMEHLFLRHAPEWERRKLDERLWRHPLKMAMAVLETFATTALLGPSEQETLDREPLAEGIRREADAVQRRAHDLADDLVAGRIPQ